MQRFFRQGGPGGQNPRVNIIIISGACCIPGMAPFDEQARRIVEQAIAETGVAAQVNVMPATTAYFGGAPKEVIAQLVSTFNQSGQVGVPAILVNGKAVSFGVPQIEAMKAALLQAVDSEASKEGETHE